MPKISYIVPVYNAEKTLKQTYDEIYKDMMPEALKGKNKYIPRVSTSYQMGLLYNAGNERIYYKNYRFSVADYTGFSKGRKNIHRVFAAKLNIQ